MSSIFYLTIVGSVLSLIIEIGNGQDNIPLAERVPDILMVYPVSEQQSSIQAYCVANDRAELTAKRVPAGAPQPNIEESRGRVNFYWSAHTRRSRLAHGLECQAKRSPEYSIYAPVNVEGAPVIPLSTTVYPDYPGILKLDEDLQVIYHSSTLNSEFMEKSIRIPYHSLHVTGFYSFEFDGRPEVYTALLISDCPRGKFGANCTEFCPACQYGGVCHPSTGECICPPGRKGNLCEGFCDPNKIGRNCSFTLERTEGIQVCLPSPYGCSCLPGYSGNRCNQECNKQSWGVNCEQSCSHCPDGMCNSVTGVCNTSPLRDPCAIVPQPPTNVTVMNSSTTSVTLSWQELSVWKPCNVSYVVRFYGKPPGEVNEHTVPTPYFRAENLTSNTLYGFQVRSLILGSGSQNLLSNFTERIEVNTKVTDEDPEKVPTTESTRTTEGNVLLNNTTTTESTRTTEGNGPLNNTTTTESTRTTEGNVLLNNATTTESTTTTGSNIHLSSVTTTELTVTTAGNGMCPAGERTFLNYRWPLNSTSPGSHADIPCQLDQDSSTIYGRWFCGNNSEWNETPDLSSCRSPNLKFPSPDEGGFIPATENITRMSESLQEKDLQTGDILYINQGLSVLQTQLENELTHLNETEALEVNERFFDGLLNLTEAMTMNTEKWRATPGDTAARLTTEFLERTVTSALSLAKRFTSNRTEKYNRQNTYTYVTSQPKSYFDAEENRLFKNENYAGTQIQFPEQFYHNYTSPRDVDKRSTNGSDKLIVLVVNFNHDLHCAHNILPCEPPTEGKLNSTAKQQINSISVEASIGYGEKWYADKDKPVEVKFSHIYNGSTYKLENQACVWWNTKNNSWSKEGCEIHITTELYTICHCYHLTNLAAIMDVNGIFEGENKYLEMLTIVGCSLSIICLAISVACFLAVMIARKKKAAMGIKKLIIRMNLCICLMLAELILLTGLHEKEKINVCLAVAALLHYFFLATFTWSAIESFNLYLFVVKIFESQITAKHYLMVGYGGPLLLVGLTLATTQGEGYGSAKRCWLESGGIIWSFAGSLILILTVNLVAFVMTMRKAWQTRRVGGTQVTNTGTSSGRRKCACLNMNKLNSSFGIFLVLGLTWITGFLVFFEATAGAAYLFVCLNAFQGVGIFIFGVTLDRVVREELLQILHEKVQHRGIHFILPCCLKERNKVGPANNSSTISSSRLVSESTITQRYQLSSDVTSEL